ncbi:MAG: hypothetical protein JRH06_14275 [Deltaproteobacteria bacterium]|nr:hypothetical protein [Deltaproteobacteria bacterium]MBW2138705.1 hypothetical protein [Deltaproteobacteria bacterium]
MDVPRKIGIGILMLIPTFVGGAALWDIFGGSWIPVAVWVIIMAGVAGGIVNEKISFGKTS